MGTPDVAVPCLDALACHPGCELVGAVCQPDRVHGRHKTPQPPPVKAAAHRHGVEVAQPKRLKSGEFPGWLAGRRPDLIVVTAYGRILPPSVLTLPALGCVNVHASLLPRWRGAAPIQWAIAAGDTESGVCLMRMDEGLDTGPVLARAITPITEEDTGESLHDRLAALGAELLGSHLPAVLQGTLPAEAQDDAGATYAPMLNREDGRLAFDRTTRELIDRVRAFYPWPGAWTTVHGALLKVFPPVTPAADRGPAGEVLRADPSGLTVGTGDGAVLLSDVQLAGRRRMAASELLRGFALPPKTRLGG